MMKKLLLAFSLTASAAFASAGIGYNLELTTVYGFFGSPDTGGIYISNNGSTDFNGSVTVTGAAGSGAGNDINQTFALSLAAGGTTSSLLIIGSEDSNVGGFNGPTGTVQLGLLVALNGNVSMGANTEGVALSVYDSNVHSGVPRVSVSGLLSDSYVLQGGDPLGFDNGDGYETTQSSGQYIWTESASTVPAPAAAITFLVSAARMRRRRSK